MRPSIILGTFSGRKYWKPFLSERDEDSWVESLANQQGLGGVLRDPGFGRNRAHDSGIQKKPSRDS